MQSVGLGGDDIVALIEVEAVEVHDFIPGGDEVAGVNLRQRPQFGV